ncbi:hypothetical protein V8C34DRAFT_100134 [Trichoderma compactum]
MLSRGDCLSRHYGTRSYYCAYSPNVDDYNLNFLGLFYALAPRRSIQRRGCFVYRPALAQHGPSSVEESTSELDGQTSTGALQMACSLAFFSCTTHIAIISVVRDHYDRHRRLQNVRFAVGALLVGPICALQIITESDAFYYDYSLSVKCAIASHNWHPRSGPGLLSTIISSGTITAHLILGLARKMLSLSKFKSPVLRKKLRDWQGSRCSKQICSY